MEFEYLVKAESRRVSLEKKGEHWIFRAGDQTLEADVRIISGNAFSLIVGGTSHLVGIADHKDTIYVSLDGTTLTLKRPGAEEKRFEKGEEGSKEGITVVKAPMPGKVVKINVAENDAVRKNQTLAIVEAMKMENEIKSPMDGVIKKIHSSAGDLVDSEKSLIEIEPKT
ncbi:MAG: biotin/lipoyl-binding protein [Candidatus Aminicenantes bacterium]|nr:biotin/lipoyl-binding protein [Candidatus Aminicenantes bacterium]